MCIGCHYIFKPKLALVSFDIVIAMPDLVATHAYRLD